MIKYGFQLFNHSGFLCIDSTPLDCYRSAVNVLNSRFIVRVSVSLVSPRTSQTTAKLDHVLQTQHEAFVGGVNELFE